MTNVGLIGSLSFCETYKNALATHDVCTPPGCTILKALENDPIYENLLLQCHDLFFEEISSSSFGLATSALKNGKNVIIEKGLLSITELNEIYHISAEGNLKCIILNSSDYYKFFEALQPEIKNPFYIEMLLDYESDVNNYLSENIENTMYECMQNMNYILKSEIKQINVKSAKLFSEQTDFISVQLDFSDGCSANIKMIEKPSKTSRNIHIFQNSNILSIDLLEETILKTEHSKGDLRISTIPVEVTDVTEKKISHFLGLEKTSKTQANSILDKYMAREQSEKIIKKINSMNE